MPDDVEAMLEELTAPLADHGLATQPEVTRRLVELVDTDYADAFAGQQDAARSAAAGVVAAHWAARSETAAGWSTPGDHERLERAFARLRAVGVLCALNAGPTASAARQAMAAARDPGEVPGIPGYAYAQWGYVCFTDREVDWLAQEPATLALMFGAWVPGPEVAEDLVAEWPLEDEEGQAEILEETAERLGRLLLEALEAEGLTCSWAGESQYRVEVSDLRWRKPLPE